MMEEKTLGRRYTARMRSVVHPVAFAPVTNSRSLRASTSPRTTRA